MSPEELRIRKICKIKEDVVYQRVALLCRNAIDFQKTKTGFTFQLVSTSNPRNLVFCKKDQFFIEYFETKNEYHIYFYDTKDKNLNQYQKKLMSFAIRLCSGSSFDKVKEVIKFIDTIHVYNTLSKLFKRLVLNKNNESISLEPRVFDNFAIRNVS